MEPFLCTAITPPYSLWRDINTRTEQLKKPWCKKGLRTNSKQSSRETVMETIRKNHREQPGVSTHFSNASTRVVRQEITLDKASSRPELRRAHLKTTKQTHSEGRNSCLWGHHCTAPTLTGPTGPFKRTFDPRLHHATVLLPGPHGLTTFSLFL